MHKLLLISRVIDDNSQNVAARVALQANVSRQTASQWLLQLKQQECIYSVGKGRNIEYFLIDKKFHKIYSRAGLDEERVWREFVAPLLESLPKNVRNIWHYGITEMVNNAIDHSESDEIIIKIKQNVLNTQVIVFDNGVGIFAKIQQTLNLLDPHAAILELVKGKLTTDPEHHSGEGIFFTSKMFDEFCIRSGKEHFYFDTAKKIDALLEQPRTQGGTIVMLKLANDTSRTVSQIFNQFAVPEEFIFAKTLVPMRLVVYGDEKLISRSQGKHLTHRLDQFQTVVLDFAGIDEIGQAFADEVFRVFQNVHPGIQIIPINMSESVNAMIQRVQKTSPRRLG